MPGLRRLIASGALACAALGACTRDYDTLFAETEPGSEGGLSDVGAIDGSVGTDVGPNLDGGGDAPVGPDADASAVDACTSCTGGACNIVCAGGCPCTPTRTCSDSTCNFVCEPGQTCSLESTSGSGTTTVTCKAGSTCDVTCATPSCSIACQGDAKCTLICDNASSANCTIAPCGTGSTQECSSGSGERRACNAQCPN